MISLPWWSYVGAGLGVGLQRQYTAPLPHCPRCLRSVERRRPGCGGVLIMSFALAVLFGIALATVGIVAGVDPLYTEAWWLGACLGVTVTAVILLRRRPEPGQASYYQAVDLISLRQEFSGNTTGVVLGFQNGDYGRRFLQANPAAVEVK